jgi:hypothetical protein
MRTTRDDLFRRYFVLDEQELKKLYKAVEEFGSNVKLEIKCKDGLSRQPENLQQLIEFENPPSREIQHFGF